MMQAMIFAAGLGTRLKPLTDKMPKAMVSVGGEPLIKHIILKMKAAGFERIIVNVHHFSNQITEFLSANGNFGIDIRISDETDALLDTGGGLKKASVLFEPQIPILIHNVDILSNIDIRSFYNDMLMIENIDNCGAMLLVSNRKTKRYLLFDDNMKLCGWTNVETGEVKTPYDNLDIDACKRYAFSGIHAFSPKMFYLMDDFPNKFSIMDFYLKTCDKIVIKGYLKDNLKLMDVGKTDTLKDADIFLNEIRQ